MLCSWVRYCLNIKCLCHSYPRKDDDDNIDDDDDDDDVDDDVFMVVFVISLGCLDCCSLSTLLECMFTLLECISDTADVFNVVSLGCYTYYLRAFIFALDGDEPIYV